MKKGKFIKTLLIFLLAFSLFISCSTAEEGSSASVTDEEALDALNVLYGDTIRLTGEEFTFTYDDASSLFPESLDAYRDIIVGYSELYANAANELSKLLTDAVRENIGVLLSYPYHAYDPVGLLSDASLFSGNRNEIISLMRIAIQDYADRNSEAFRRAYDELSFECNIVKENMDNLETVGASSELRRVTGFNFMNAYSFCAERAYMALYQNEIRLRNTPLSLQDNSIYLLFWEAA